MHDTGLAGLPDSTCPSLRDGSRMESMGLCEILSRARAVLVEERGDAAAVDLPLRLRHRDQLAKGAFVTDRSCS